MHFELPQFYRAAAAAAALMLALGFASIAKARLLSRRSWARPINNWRWPLVWAAAPAVVAGWLATRYLPEWAELAFGSPGDPRALLLDHLDQGLRPRRPRAVPEKRAAIKTWPVGLPRAAGVQSRFTAKLASLAAGNHRAQGGKTCSPHAPAADS